MKKTKNAAERIVAIDPFRVKPFAGQPRKDFRGIERLKKSIDYIGQRTPIDVSPIAEKGFDYQLIDGERRLKACQALGIEIEAVVRTDPGGERFALSIASNFHRQSHNCLEISDAIQTLKKSGKTIADIAEIFGKSRTFVFQHDSLAKLHPQVQKMLLQPPEGKKRERFGGSGRMTLQTALMIVPLPQDAQLLAAKTICAKKMDPASARRMVSKKAHHLGIAVGSVTSAADHFNRLTSRLDKLRSLVGEYLDMPYEKIQRIRLGVAPSVRNRLSKLIESATDELLQFDAALMAESKKCG